MNYFAYGSNLWPARLSARIGNCRVRGVAVARGWILTFNKEGGDGSAKCDAQYTGDENDYLYGAIYEVTVGQREELDVYEGLGHGYDIENIDVVELIDSERRTRTLAAQTYVAIPDHHFRQRQSGDNRVLPYTWYYQYVLQGARHHRFPDQKITEIQAHDHQPDPNPTRVQKNTHILSLTQSQAATLAGTPHAT